MTSTPVKDAAPLLNFARGSRAAASSTKSGAAGNFGEVMSKTSYSGGKLSSQKKVNAGNGEDLKNAKINQPLTHREALNGESGSDAVKTGRSDTVQEQALSEAGSNLVEETAKELGISEEEVIDAMEELGFGMVSLLDADNLTKLVMVLSGEDSPLALLTDEGLYGKMQNLLQSLDEIRTELTETVSISIEEPEPARLAELRTEIAENGMVQTENYADVLQQGSEEAGEAGEAKITITVEQGTDSIELTADENGNVEQVQKVVPKEEETEEDSSGEQQSGNFEGGEEKQGLIGTNPVLDAVLENRTQNAEEVFSQTAETIVGNTEEIMNQILDYMKIQLKPGMEQLEMQLHPESLGTLHIQITSKGGEMTAQFHVQNEAVKAVLESQIVELKDSLKEQGVKVEAVEVAVESHAFESSLWQGQERDGGTAYQDSRKAPRRINLNALNEGFEETADEEELLAAEMLKVSGGTVDYTA